jgi:hypothetical protein
MIQQGSRCAFTRLDAQHGQLTSRPCFKIPEGPPVPSRLAVRLDDVILAMAADPRRDWHVRDIAAALNTVKPETLAIHMSAWAKKKLLVKTAPATYTLPLPQAPAGASDMNRPSPTDRVPERSLARSNQPSSRAA